MVFYDEDGDGVPSADEVVRLPGVEVVIGDATARTAAGGRAVVQAPLGAQTVALRNESVPAYYLPVAPRPVSVPTSDEVFFPVLLPISGRPNVYMAFGDSLTAGEGSSDGEGYRGRLAEQLSAYLGTAEVVNEGRGGTQTNEGADRVGRALGRRRPAYTLVMYGINDWNTLACQAQAAPPCQTIDEMRSILDEVKAFGSLPVLSTIVPANPALDPPERNQWVQEENQLLAELARAEGVPLADSAKLFFAQSNLPALYSDHVHPNDAGYALIAQAFFEAVTGPRSITTASSLFRSPRR